MRHRNIVDIFSFGTLDGGQYFYVNFGIVCAAVTALGGDTTGSSVIGTHVVQWGPRLEELVRGMPSNWPPDTDGVKLCAGIEKGIAKLDPLDGAAAMLEHLDLEGGFNKILRAQLKWICGDKKGARADIAAVAKEFSDRNACSVAELTKDAGLG